jgi:amidase
VRDVNVPQMADLEIEGRDGIEEIWDHDFREGMSEFLSGFVNAQVATVEDIVKFNTEHADLELPASKKTQHVSAEL